MQKDDCEFLPFCLSGADNECKKDITHKCDEFIRKTNLKNSPCLVMVKGGYPGNICYCDAPQIRTILPVGIDCSINGNCIRKIIPELSDFEETIRTSKKINYPELLLIIKKTKRHLQNI